MKKIILLLISILCIIPIKINAIYLESDNYVILKDTKIKEEVKNYINNYSKHLKNYADIRFYILLSNEDIEEEEINKLEEEIYTKHKGLLLIGFKETGTIKIRVGNDISRLFTETEINNILEEYAIPEIEKSNWNQAIKNTYIILYKKITNTYYVPNTEMEIEEEDLVEQNKVLFTFIFIGIGIVLSINICNFFKKKKRKRNNLDYFLVTTSIILNFILLYVVIIYISLLAMIPILIGELTLIAIYYKEPAKIKKKKKTIRKR